MITNETAATTTTELDAAQDEPQPRPVEVSPESREFAERALSRAAGACLEWCR